MPTTPFSTLIKEARNRRDLSQIEASKAIGVSQPFYSEVERGKKLPRRDKFPDWARVLAIREELLEDALKNTLAIQIGPTNVLVDFKSEETLRLVTYYAANGGWKTVENFLYQIALDVVDGKRPLTRP